VNFKESPVTMKSCPHEMFCDPSRAH